MKDIILFVIFIAAMAFGLFFMIRLNIFFEENKKSTNNRSCKTIKRYILLSDSISEDHIDEIKTSHPGCIRTEAEVPDEKDRIDISTISLTEFTENEVHKNGKTSSSR